jgi:hypothetical protein
VGLADTLDAVEVDWMSHLDFIIPALLQEIIKVTQLLLQGDEEQFTILVLGKATSHGKFGESGNHDICSSCFPLSADDEDEDNTV